MSFRKNLYKNYQKLQTDFQDPLRAMLFLNHLWLDPIVLKTKSGHEFTTSKEDFPIWQEYFNPQTCDVEISDNLFKIIPFKNHPPYFIKGGYYRITHQPKRFFPEVLNHAQFHELHKSEKRIFSQHGEDGVIEKIFSMIPTPHRFVVEFGAHDGVKMSNSRNLIINNQWSGFLIEAMPKLFKKLEKAYRNHPKVEILKSFVTVENINELFRKAKVPYDFELLSIDVDSIDYYLWEALTEFQPRLVIIECNPIIPPDEIYVVSRDKALELGGTRYEGASFKAMVELGKRKGYELIYTELVGSNLFFLHKSYLKHLNYEPLDDRLKYQPPQFGQLAEGPALNGRGFY